MVKMMLLALSLSVAACGTALAAHPLVTDDTGTQGKGRFQLELNGEITHDDEGSAGITVKERSAELATILSTGITEDIDIIVGFPWQWSRVKENGMVVDDNNGAGDTSLEVKWRFLKRDGFSLAVKPVVTFPSGDEHRGLGNGKISYGATLIASQEWERFFVHANAAYTRNEFRLEIDRHSNRHDLWHGSIAAGAEVVKNVTVVANVGMETHGDRETDTWPAFILGGVIYSVTDNIDLDLGVKGALNHPEPDIAALAGMAWRF